MTISHHEKGKTFGTAVYFYLSYTFTALTIGFGGEGTILKQTPFWGVNFSLVRNMSGVKFYDTATAV